MALFFDTVWFDARLAASHLSRADVARALGVSDVEIAEIWKDQRELTVRDVATLAALLAVTPQDVAKHAGISTPVPRTDVTLFDLAARVTRLEAEIAELKTMLARK